MALQRDGMNYSPVGKKTEPVVGPGDFAVGVMHLDHGHINGMCRGLREAGAEIAVVYEPDPAKLAAFRKAFPEAKVARSADEVLEDGRVKLVAAAAVTSERGPLGCRVMQHGKDYFTDKAPFTRLDQLEEARRVVAETGRIYACYYSERLHTECGMFAGDLIKDGAIGRVLQVLGLGPHRLNAPSRPDWFFKKETFGGILCDIGSHQVEQFLFYSGATDAEVVHSAVANHGHPEYPEFEDFGEANLIANNGATNYFRVDWFNPDGLRTWGDGRTVILGTEGYIEMRKYIDVARDASTDHLYLVDKNGEQHLELSGTVGYPYFGQLILDCLNRTERAMPQAHTFKAAELCLKAQAQARRLPSGPAR
jgi:predicted dehydrogenase